MSILSTATNWLVKTGLEAAFGGDSGGGGGGVSGKGLAEATRQTQQQLSSIQGRQVLQQYGAHKKNIQSAGMGASRPPDAAPRHEKGRLGLQLLQRARQGEVSDPLMMQLVTKQASRTGNITDDVMATIKGSYKTTSLDTGTRTRKTARGSFLDK